MTFFDTSVLVAATQKNHSHHRESLSVVTAAGKGRGACAAHSVAELYSVLTRAPRPQRMAPNDAVAVLEVLRERMKIVELDAGECLDVIRGVARRGLSGGIVHDALIVRCAVKIAARKVYTLNGKHFKLVAPELAESIFEP